MSKIVLETEEPLTPDERGALRQLLYDAFGEFVTARGGGRGNPFTMEDAIKYVRERYPDMGIVQRQKKAEEVFARKMLARKLRIAASNVSVVEE